MTDITILIVAAGAARRMLGSDKLLMAVDGIPQLRRIALQALMTGCPVLVALPAGDGLRRAALAGLNLTILPVENPEQGMSAAMRAGGAAARGALMIMPADMPEIGTSEMMAMIAAHAAHPQAILRGTAVASAAAMPGHPVVLPADLIPALADLRGDSGARRLIDAHANRVVTVPLAGQRAVLDLDTPEDWAAWLAARPAAPAPGHPLMANPLTAALAQPQTAVLAVITGVSGASYRSPGAMMCFFPNQSGDGSWAGSLTNGCIEGDLALHAAEALASGRPARLRYGTGSPFFDIRLPCGGGLDVLLVPAPDARVLGDLACLRQCRTPLALTLGPEGSLNLCPSHPTGWRRDSFVIDQRPDLRILIWGEGPEATVFTRLVHSAGYAHHLNTDSAVTAEAVMATGCSATVQSAETALHAQAVDPWTAIVTFYHDHDKELAVLAHALQSPAFYVGAQGSRRVAETRLARLAERGLAADLCARLHGPIGLIPSARDPKTLAVSVLAEIIAAAQP